VTAVGVALPVPPPDARIVRAALRIATTAPKERDQMLETCKPHVRTAIELELAELRWRWKEWPAPFSEIAEMETEVQADDGTWRGWNVADAQALCLDRYDSVNLVSEVRAFLQTKMER
jgi:hypothetical protein